MKTCIHCGEENAENAMYCDYCFEALDEDDPPIQILFEWLKDR